MIGGLYGFRIIELRWQVGWIGQAIRQSRD